MWSFQKDHIPRTDIKSFLEKVVDRQPIPCRNQLKSISIRKNLDSDFESVAAGCFAGADDEFCFAAGFGGKIKIHRGVWKGRVQVFKTLVTYWGIHPGNLT